MEEYILLVYQSIDNRYFVKCDSLERAKKLGKVYKDSGAQEVIIYKGEYIDHVF